MNLIPKTPEVPAGDWLDAFSSTLMHLKPGLPADNANRCAALAYPGTWLLEPEEAAQLWLAALEHAVRATLRP